MTEQDSDAVDGGAPRIGRPWSTRWPQNLVFALLAVAVTVTVTVTGVSYLRRAEGGVVPYLMVGVAPALGLYYAYYFLFMKHGDSS